MLLSAKTLWERPPSGLNHAGLPRPFPQSPRKNRPAVHQTANVRILEPSEPPPHTQTDTQTHTDTDTHTHTHTHTHMHTHTFTQTHRHTHRHTQAHTHTDTQAHTQTHTHRHTHRHTGTHTDTQAHTQAHTVPQMNTPHGMLQAWFAATFWALPPPPTDPSRPTARHPGPPLRTVLCVSPWQPPGCTLMLRKGRGCSLCALQPLPSLPSSHTLSRAEQGHLLGKWGPHALPSISSGTGAGQRLRVRAGSTSREAHGGLWA